MAPLQPGRSALSAQPLPGPAAEDGVCTRPNRGGSGNPAFPAACGFGRPACASSSTASAPSAARWRRRWRCPGRSHRDRPRHAARCDQGRRPAAANPGQRRRVTASLRRRPGRDQPSARMTRFSSTMKCAGHGRRTAARCVAAGVAGPADLFALRTASPTSARRCAASPSPRRHGVMPATFIGAGRGCGVLEPAPRRLRHRALSRRQQRA